MRTLGNVSPQTQEFVWSCPTAKPVLRRRRPDGVALAKKETLVFGQPMETAWLWSREGASFERTRPLDSRPHLWREFAKIGDTSSVPPTGRDVSRLWRRIKTFAGSNGFLFTDPTAMAQTQGSKVSSEIWRESLAEWYYEARELNELGKLVSLLLSDNEVARKRAVLWPSSSSSKLVRQKHIVRIDTQALGMYSDFGLRDLSPVATGGMQSLRLGSREEPRDAGPVEYLKADPLNADLETDESEYVLQSIRSRLGEMEERPLVMVASLDYRAHLLECWDEFETLGPLSEFIMLGINQKLRGQLSTEFRVRKSWAHRVSVTTWLVPKNMLTALWLQALDELIHSAPSRHCAVCGKIFLARYRNKMYCSRACVNKASRFGQKAEPLLHEDEVWKLAEETGISRSGAARILEHRPRWHAARQKSDPR